MNHKTTGNSLSSYAYANLLLGWMLVIAWGVASAHAGDWPQFRGPKQDGVSTETGINKNWAEKPPQVVWTCELSDDGFGGPCVAQGKVYIVDHQGTDDIVRALDAETGKEIWRFACPGPSQSRNGFTGATPTVDHGNVIVIGRKGIVHALKADTGKMIWERDIMADFKGRFPEWDMNISPVVDDGRLIVVPGGADASVVALNEQTGETIWRGAGSEPGYATPLVVELDGQKQYVTFTAEGLAGWKPETGQRLWSVPWITPHKQNAATPIVMGNRIFISSAWGAGCALVEVKANNPKVLWSNKTMLARFNSPVFWKGFIYGVSEPGNLKCIDAATGELQWEKAGFEFGPVMVVDGALIAVNGKSGAVILIEAKSGNYRELGRIQPLAGSVWTAPIVANGKLLVRNKKTLACLNIQDPEPAIQRNN
ncbi:MAG: PQQ-binding-like beta-propeller repeat protein [Methylacidiphilales bacterium]|nr:PQQ-binding-like beta-propeller repeat protein [Candidatus Methylacidiphilales bacterium]